METDSARILVVGATGQLGGAVADKLLAAGIPVRAFGRNRERLAELEAAGAEVVTGDLLDTDAVSRACAGVGQLFTSANNVMGHGASSPTRIDIPAHRNLLDAAARHGVRRFVYVGARGLGGPTSPVDYFRVKHQIEEMVQRSGVPYVVLRASAFLETWAALLLGNGIRDDGVAVLFGDGRQRSNFIAIDDVAEFALRILRREDVVNEIVEVGGPSNLSYAEIATLVERALGVTAKRRHVPIAVLRLGSLLLRPVNEATARKLALGYFAATRDAQFDAWRQSAERFGVDPIPAERFIAQWSGRATP